MRTGWLVRIWTAKKWSKFFGLMWLRWVLMNFFWDRRKRVRFFLNETFQLILNQFFFLVPFSLKLAVSLLEIVFEKSDQKLHRTSGSYDWVEVMTSCIKFSRQKKFLAFSLAFDGFRLALTDFLTSFIKMVEFRRTFNFRGFLQQIQLFETLKFLISL